MKFGASEWIPLRKCFKVHMQLGSISVYVLYIYIYIYIYGLSWVLIIYGNCPTGTVFLFTATLQLGLCYLF